MPHKGRNRTIPICGSGMRDTHCKPDGFSSGGQLPVPPALDLTEVLHTYPYSAMCVQCTPFFGKKQVEKRP